MEKLNIAELLKDCPKGMELDCTMYEDCKFLDIDTENYGYSIRIITPCGLKYLDKYGRYTIDDKAKCIIFPKGKTTWEGFQRPFKDGDVVFYDDNIAIFKEWGDATLFRTYAKLYIHREFIDIDIPLFGKYVRKETRLATEEEKQKLFKAIKDNGYKWNQETKTLKELEVVMRMWISRGEGDNYCVLFKEKPYKYYDKLCKKHFFKTDNMYGTYMCLPAGYFPSVTFENSPQQVEIKLIENDLSHNNPE